MIEERRLRDMVCPQCKEEFELAWQGYFDNKPMTLILQGCPSGGIYNIYISCPHCSYEEEL